MTYFAIHETLSCVVLCCLTLFIFKQSWALSVFFNFNVCIFLKLITYFCTSPI